MKILMYSDSPTVHTGYGRVMSILAPAFQRMGHEVRVIGNGYNGESHEYTFEILGTNPQLEYCGEFTIKRCIRDFKPDLFFSLGDPWSAERIPNMAERKGTRWMFYFPLDGEPVPKDWHSILRDVDYPVTFSKYSHKLAQDLIHDKQVDLIYHGVRTDLFHKFPNKQEMKKSFGVGNKFMVGMVARNNPRKNIPALIRAFARFAEKKDDVGLYLHTVRKDIGWDIDDLIDQYGLIEKFFYTQALTNPAHGIPDSMMNTVYNIFDVFALPTMAEGFGLPLMEANACEVPIIVTDCSVTPELVVDKYRQLIKTKCTLVMNRNIEQAIADEDDLVKKLEWFYRDWKKDGGREIERIGKKSRELAEQFQWEDKVKEFESLLNRVQQDIEKNGARKYEIFHRI